MVLDIIGTGLSLYGSIRGAQAKRKAEAEARRQALEQRATVKEATDQAVSQIQAGAQPLFAQAVGLERASRFRDPLVEQGLVAGLRQQAGAQATQGRQMGQSDQRGAVIGQLLRGQGLLAAESQRLQRFQQLSQMAAQVRSQGAQVLGQAAQARMEGAATLAGINVPVVTTDPTASGLFALGKGLTALDEAGAFDSDDEFEVMMTPDPPSPDVIAPEEIMPTVAEDIRTEDLIEPDLTEYQPITPSLGTGLGRDIPGVEPLQLRLRNKPTPSGASFDMSRPMPTGLPLGDTNLGIYPNKYASPPPAAQMQPGMEQNMGALMFYQRQLDWAPPQKQAPYPRGGMIWDPSKNAYIR